MPGIIFAPDAITTFTSDGHQLTILEYDGKLDPNTPCRSLPPVTVFIHQTVRYKEPTGCGPTTVSFECGGLDILVIVDRRQVRLISLTRRLNGFDLDCPIRCGASSALVGELEYLSDINFWYATATESFGPEPSLFPAQKPAVGLDCPTFVETPVGTLLGDGIPVAIRRMTQRDTGQVDFDPWVTLPVSIRPGSGFRFARFYPSLSNHPNFVFDSYSVDIELFGPFGVFDTLRREYSYFTNAPLAIRRTQLQVRVGSFIFPPEFTLNERLIEGNPPPSPGEGRLIRITGTIGTRVGPAEVKLVEISRTECVPTTGVPLVDFIGDVAGAYGVSLALGPVVYEWEMLGTCDLQ